MRRVTGHQQRTQIGVAQREVDVLTRPVDAGERLLVEQALHAVLLGDRLEDGHQQLLMIGGDVAALEHRRDLELPWGNLVVARLGGDAELEQLTLGVHHEAQHPLGHRSEVVVVELLALRRLRAEQRATRIDQVGTAPGRSGGRRGSTPAPVRRTRRSSPRCRGRTVSGSARHVRPSPAGCEAAESCSPAPHRSSTRTPWGYTRCCRSGSPGCRPGW